MLSMLVNKYPEIMDIIKTYLKRMVAEAERRYNAPAGSYHYRFFRPDDPGIGGTEKIYWQDRTNADAEELISGGSALTVPVSNAYAIFGWYIDADFGNDGYLQIDKQGVNKSEIPARTVYLMKNPKHLYIDFDAVIVGFQQEKIEFWIYNGFGADQKCLSFPFMFRIASKSALNLE